jgi:nondiscriminating glutamyl-tRNA synthetase
MSKRHGATAIEQYQDKGYLPGALTNFLALLGWSPGGEEEVFSLDELKQHFTLDRVAKSPAVFDLEKLNWLNGHYIRETDLERLTEMAVPYLEKEGFIRTPLPPKRFEWLKMVVASVRKQLSYMQEIAGYVKFYFDDNMQIENEEAQQIMAGEQVKPVLLELIKKVNASAGITEDGAKALLKEVGRDLGIKGKQIFMPVRVALTGSTQGPDLNQVMVILGRDGVIRRLTKWV